MSVAGVNMGSLRSTVKAGTSLAVAVVLQVASMRFLSGRMPRPLMIIDHELSASPGRQEEPCGRITLL
jgi:hypothetical protein